MKKVIFVLLAVLISNFGWSQNRMIIDKIVGTVGNELVLLSDIEEQYDLMQKQQGVLPDNFQCVILENQLAEKLLLNQSKLDSIQVSEEEVEAQLQARIDQILTYMNNDLEQFRDYYGQSVSDVKEMFREDLRNQLLVQRMRGTIVAKITVTPSEVKEFFASIPTDSLPYFNSEVEVGEIVYKPKVNDEQNSVAREKLEKLRVRITEGGEDFSELAVVHSDDPASARIGGDLGMQRRGTFVSEFEAAAYNLEPGQISDIVETQFGFHLLQLIERRGNNIHARHILVKPLITQADLTLARNELDSIQQLVQKDSMSFSLAVKKFSDKDAQSYNNDGDIINPNTGKTIFETSDLDPEIYFTIDTLGIGDVSSPFEFTDRGGEVAYRVVLLKSRTAPHRANLQEDYSKIKAAAIERKTSIAVNEWVQGKIKSTFIEVDGMYDCEGLKSWINSSSTTSIKP